VADVIADRVEDMGKLSPAMTPDRFAELLKIAWGAKLTSCGGIWWKATRPYFHRPLLPYQTCNRDSALTTFGRFRAFQHGVTQGEPYNSYLNFIAFDDVRNYDAARLHQGARRNLNTATKSGVVIRRVTSESEFSAKAYDVHLSAYRRNAFETPIFAERNAFTRWTHHLFEFPEPIILGAFLGTELLSFEIGFLIGDTLLLDTIRHSDKGLALRSSDLLLHCWRKAARETDQVCRIYDSMLADRSGVNEFKIRRGGKIVSLPAYLHLPSAVLYMIEKLNRAKYHRLLGHPADERLADETR
jgi:hypothetical protein